MQGARGSGKTVACVQWMKHMEEAGYINKTYLISPTAETNPIFKNLRTLQEDNVCSDPSLFQAALGNVLESVKQDMVDYKKYLKQKKLYDKYLKGGYLDMVEKATLEATHYAAPTGVEPPRNMLILDDVQSSDVFTSRRNDIMVHMTVKHRHIPLSIIFLVQTFHGLPRPIRLNCTIYMVFSTSDEKQLEQIYQHFGNLVTRDVFFSKYRYAVSQPHGFLMIDTDPKSPQKRFRSGFNEFLNVKN